MSYRKLLVLGLVVLAGMVQVACGVSSGGGADDDEPDELRYVYYVGETDSTVHMLRWDLNTGVTENVFSDPNIDHYFSVDSKTKDVFYTYDFGRRIVRYAADTGMTNDVHVNEDPSYYEFVRFANDRLYIWQDEGTDGSGIYTSLATGEDYYLFLSEDEFTGFLRSVFFSKTKFYVLSHSAGVLYFYSGDIDGSNFHLDFTLDQFGAPRDVVLDVATGYWYVPDHDVNQIFRVNSTGSEVIFYSSELVVDMSDMRGYSGHLFWTNDDQGEVNNHTFYHSTSSSNVQAFDVGVNLEQFELVLD
ncbi:MAG: hypothetical protein O3A01_01235 [bacterium]|nr:hypothetical protein [bacterium]